MFGSGEDTDVQVLGTGAYLAMAIRVRASHPHVHTSALAHLSLSLVKLKSTIHLQATSLDPDAVIRVRLQDPIHIRVLTMIFRPREERINQQYSERPPIFPPANHSWSPFV